MKPEIPSFACAPLLLLLACGGTDVVLGDGIDAATAPDSAGATADATTPAPDGPAMTDAGVCACGPSSCGARTCGRSECGYPCGTCDGAEWCNLGTCQAGSPPGPLCTDAFSWPGWGRVHYGDIGLRVCPGDPTQVESCTCSTGGPDSWEPCSGSCFTPCGGDVTCGSTTCGPLEYCQGCSDGVTSTFECRPRSQSPSCTAGGLELYVLCDGDEDCAATDRCMAVVGDMVRLSCEPDTTVATCVAGAGYYDLCGSLADCPACATSCSALTYADWTTATGYDGVQGVCQ